MYVFLKTIDMTKFSTRKMTKKLQVVLKTLNYYFEYKLSNNIEKDNVEYVYDLYTQFNILCLEMIKMLHNDLNNLEQQRINYKDKCNLDSINAINSVISVYQLGAAISLLKLVGLYKTVSKMMMEQYFDFDFSHEQTIFNALELKLQEQLQYLIKQPKFGIFYNLIKKYIFQDNWQELFINQLINLDLPIYNKIIINLIADRRSEYSKIFFELNKLEIILNLYTKDDQIGILTSQIFFHFGSRRQEQI